MKSYIIRIYRGEKGGQLLGTVERPREDVKLAFTSFDELRDILGPHAARMFSSKCGNGKLARNQIKGPLKPETTNRRATK